MSQLSLHYRFFGIDAKQWSALETFVQQQPTTDALLEYLAIKQILEDSDEYLEGFSVESGGLDLEVVARAGGHLNHALVRAFKSFGAEFCHVQMFNDQVGESTSFYLHRGRPVNGDSLQKLLDLHDPDLRIRDMLRPGALGLATALENDLDANRLVDNIPLLAHAIANENRIALDLLLEYGANLNVMINDVPLMCFAVSGVAKPDIHGIVSQLVLHGANIDCFDDDGIHFSWLLGEQNPLLFEELTANGMALHRPADAYDDEEPTANLHTALEHRDHVQRDVLFPTLINDPEHHNGLAVACCTHGFLAGLDQLLAMGFNPLPVKTGDGDDEFDDEDDDTYQTASQVDGTLLEAAANDMTLACLPQLLDIAEQQQLDIQYSLDYLVDTIVPWPTSSPILQRLLPARSHAAIKDALETGIRTNALHALPTIIASIQQYNQNNADTAIDVDFSYLIANMTPACFNLLLDAGFNPFRQTETDIADRPDDGDEYDEGDDTQEISLIDRCFDAKYDDSQEPVRADTIEAVLDMIDSWPAGDALFGFLGAQHTFRFTKRWQATSVAERNTFDLSYWLCSAAILGNSDIVFLLLQHGVDANKQAEPGATPLACAVNSRHRRVVLQLLNAGANPDSVIPDAFLVIDEDDEDDPETDALLDAAGLGQTEQEKNGERLMTMNVYPDSSNANCVNLAAANGDADILALLLAAGAKPSVISDFSQQAIHYAVNNGHADAVNVLLTHGLKLPEKDGADMTLVHYASMRGHGDILRSLIRAGAPLDTPGPEGQSPLAFACLTSMYRDDDSTAHQLLDAGVDIQCMDSMGNTALFYASACGRVELVERLLLAGANVNRVNKDGDTAFDIYQSQSRQPDAVSTNFDTTRLKPSDKAVVFKRLGRRAIGEAKRLAPVLGVALIVGWFSALAGVAIVAVYIAYRFGMAWLSRTAADEAAIEIDNEDTSVGSMLLKGLQVMESVQEDIVKQEAANQAIIDSWDEDDKKAA